MVVHSLLICSASKKQILLSKYFSCINEVTFEQDLLLHTEPYWQKAIKDNCIHAITIDDIYIVFQVFGGIMVLISGTNDIDELILSQIMICFHQVLMDILDKSLLESLILDIENYAKICVAIDEMISLQGVIECLDVDVIMKQSKLKN
mmetsp:Transcript_9957/g.9679  ORF Transcript_9957/g.9679 Transcript_9957/m.9679 type:complete len:148 (+) Transcript_9957:58-501(+)